MLSICRRDDVQSAEREQTQYKWITRLIQRFPPIDRVHAFQAVLVFGRALRNA